MWNGGLPAFTNFLEINPMSAKNILANLFLPESVSKIQRDYWRIEEFECLATGGCAALIQGRRRTSEPFWPGLRLDWPTLHTFGDTMRNAVAVAAGFCVDERQATNGVFPNTETLAICQGSQYVIETCESLNGFGKKSISTTIFQLGPQILPAVHFIDEELEQFAQDMKTMIERLTDAQENSTPWRPPLIGIL